jgi:hypothetical protein
VTSGFFWSGDGGDHRIARLHASSLDLWTGNRWRILLYIEEYTVNLSEGFVVGDVTLLNVPPLSPHAFHPFVLAR